MFRRVVLVPGTNSVQFRRLAVIGYGLFFGCAAAAVVLNGVAGETGRTAMSRTDQIVPGGMLILLPSALVLTALMTLRIRQERAAGYTLWGGENQDLDHVDVRTGYVIREAGHAPLSRQDSRAAKAKIAEFLATQPPEAPGENVRLPDEIDRAAEPRVAASTPTPADTADPLPVVRGRWAGWVWRSVFGVVLVTVFITSMVVRAAGDRVELRSEAVTGILVVVIMVGIIVVGTLMWLMPGVRRQASLAATHPDSIVTSVWSGPLLGSAGGLESLQVDPDGGPEGRVGSLVTMVVGDDGVSVWSGEGSRTYSGAGGVIDSEAGRVSTVEARGNCLAEIVAVTSRIGKEMAEEHSTDQEKNAKLLSLERVQRGLQWATGALSTTLLFSISFLIPAIVNCLLVVVLLSVMVVLDRRIRGLGGKGGFYVGAER